MAILKFLVGFSGIKGSVPYGSLLADSQGDLLGATAAGGASSDGTAFEILDTGAGYASRSTTLVSFNGYDDAVSGGLLADSNGGLFGTNVLGWNPYWGGFYAGASGAAFAIARIGAGSAGAPAPRVNVIANGVFKEPLDNLVGAAQRGGAVGEGAAFEIAGSSYALATSPHPAASPAGETGASGETLSVAGVMPSQSPASSASESFSTIYGQAWQSFDATPALARAALDANNLSVTGAGIKVGVISNSFNSYNLPGVDLGYGTVLPSQLLVDPLNDLRSVQSNWDDEGRAMMQVIHDIAPGASLDFCTAEGTAADFQNGIQGSDRAFADAILALAQDGCKVICDDYLSPDQPWFQSGVVADAIQTVEQEGVTYLSCAGNSGSASSQGSTVFSDPAYQSAWNQTSVSLYFPNLGYSIPYSDALNFGSGPFQTLTLQHGASCELEMQWAQPWGAATTDLALIVSQPVVINGVLFNEVVGGTGIGGLDFWTKATNPMQNGESVNLQACPLVLGPELQNTYASGAESYQISIVNLNGSNPSLVKYMASSNSNSPGALAISGENAGTVSGWHESPYQITVGAADAGNSPPLSEYFSASGAGTEWLYAPDGSPYLSPKQLFPVAVTGIDDINTSDVVNGIEYNGFYIADYQNNNGNPKQPQAVDDDFFGTSCATPSVAAIAALMLQQNGNLTPFGIRDLLEQSATPMAYNAVSGAGLADAGKAVSLAAKAGPAITGTVAGQTTTSEASIAPFSGVTVADPDSRAIDTLTITLAGAGGTLSGTGLSGGTGGVYTLTGAASTVTSELEALSFKPTAGSPGTTSTSTFTLSDLSSASATPTVNTTTTVVDKDPAAAPVVTLAAAPAASNGTNATLGTAAPGYASDALTVTLSSDADFASGSKLALTNGSLVYTPGLVTAQLAGQDTLKYIVTDTVTGTATSETQTVTLSNGPAPVVTLAAAPAASNGTSATLGTAASGYANDALTVTLSSDADFATGSSLTLNVGNLTYTPGAIPSNIVGTNDTLKYTVTDTVTGAVTTETQQVALSATLTTLASFNGANGSWPTDGVLIDAGGNLFGTSQLGGANNDGAVFEIARTTTGYAAAPTVLASFTGANGYLPKGGLIADGNGDLFGVTEYGGAYGYGTVFEIAKTAAGYASAPATLVSFSDSPGIDPDGSLLADASGDLFGVTVYGGAYGYGTVFEIVKTAAGYASAPTTLTSFNNAGGGNPWSTLISDANGDLFGTTGYGGANGNGTVFEIARTAAGYAATPAVLATFNGANGSDPQGGLIADGNGDLFGVTNGGGAYGDGAVFEIVKSANGYASAPTTLVSFNGADGQGPVGPSASLIADANGDLFGATANGGAYGDGAVFEIVNTATGYAATPKVLASFTGAAASYPLCQLVADAAGDLFGATIDGGTNNVGSVFEIANTGFAVAPPVVTLAAMSPTAASGRPTTLGSAVSANGFDGLAVTLVSDAAFASGSSLTLSNGVLAYTPGPFTGTLASADALKYTVADTVTGASMTETQTVILSNGPVVVTVATFLANRAALDKVVGGFSISDTAAGISAALDSLNDPNILTITVSDNGAVGATVAQLTGDATGIGKLVNANATPYTLAVTDALATIVGSLGGLDGNSHVASLTATSGSATVSGGATIAAPKFTFTGASTVLTLAEILAYSGSLTEGAGSTASISSGDTLTLKGTTSLSGVVGGAGTLALAGGSTTVAAGASLSVAAVSVSGSGTSVTLGENLTYAGTFGAGAGTTLALSGDTLTLTGKTSFTGAATSSSGTLAAKGTTALSGLTIGGTTAFNDLGTLTQSGGSATVGDSAGNVATLSIASTGTWKILDNSGIARGSSNSSSISNSGLLEKTGGTGVTAITPNVTNIGVNTSGANVNGGVYVSSGTLDFKGTVTGGTAAKPATDTITGSSTLEFDSSVGSSTVIGAQDIVFTGAGTLNLKSPTNFYGEISGFASNDAVDLLGNWTFSSFSENSGGTLGTLTLASGSTKHAFEFVGAFSQSSFAIHSGATTIIGHT